VGSGTGHSQPSKDEKTCSYSFTLWPHLIVTGQKVFAVLSLGHVISVVKKGRPVQTFHRFANWWREGVTADMIRKCSTFTFMPSTSVV
jgi:hypothetical protein